MAAPRPKKKTIIKKKAPAKKVPIKKTDVKSPEETRKSISRKQVGTSRPARGLPPEGAKARALTGMKQQGRSLTVSQPEKVRMNFMDKLLREGTPNRATTPRVINQGYTPGSASRAVVPFTATSATPTPSAGSKTLAFLKGVGSRAAGAAGAIVDPSFMSNEYGGAAGPGSTVPGQAQKAVEKKMKREIRQGPKLAVTGVKEGTTRRLAPTGSRKPAPGANYSGQEKKKIPMKPAPGANYSGQSSTYSGYGNFNPSKIKTNATNTAATSTAAAGSKGGSKAAKAGGSVTTVSKAKVGKQTRYQRNETAMEQKRSSNRPKKSIFSLFRKG
jgi:hypothetical protein